MQTHAVRSTALTLVLCLSLSVSVIPFAQAEPPGEVGGLTWCPQSRDCLTWSPLDGAEGYRLYRGHGTALPALLDASDDCCLVGSYAESTSGVFAGGMPLPGGVYWYLVTAHDGLEEGSPGTGSSTLRVLDSSGPCEADFRLVLNEVDYDQPGTDTAEFVEIHNPGSAPQSLDGVALILVNGGTAEEYARVDLGQAGAEIPALGYFVVGTASVVASLPPGVPSVEFPGSSNNVQNGAPDGIALVDLVTGRLIDALSYEGAVRAAQFEGLPGDYDLVAGDPTGVADSNSIDGTLVRFPDGADSGDASLDWRFSNTPTPGGPNAMP